MIFTHIESCTFLFCLLSALYPDLVFILGYYKVMPYINYDFHQNLFFLTE
jgi:hypothetical protein